MASPKLTSRTTHADRAAIQTRIVELASAQPVTHRGAHDAWATARLVVDVVMLAGASLVSLVIAAPDGGAALVAIVLPAVLSMLALALRDVRRRRLRCLAGIEFRAAVTICSVAGLATAALVLVTDSRPSLIEDVTVTTLLAAGGRGPGSRRRGRRLSPPRRRRAASSR